MMESVPLTYFVSTAAALASAISCITGRLAKDMAVLPAAEEETVKWSCATSWFDAAKVEPVGSAKARPTVPEAA